MMSHRRSAADEVTILRGKRARCVDYGSVEELIKKFKKLLGKSLWNAGLVNGEFNMDTLKGLLNGYAYGAAGDAKKIR